MSQSHADMGVLDTSIPLQPASVDVWDKKYRLKSNGSDPIDQTIDDTYRRVAKALASVEKDPQHWEKEFVWALQNGAIPAGRIMSNAGAGGLKSATSTINCTVSGTIRDSMESILENVKDAGLTLKSGAGIGYEFSTLRPRGAFVSGAGAFTSGPLSFMEIFDSMCKTISSAGSRRGAQMATFDVRHPDVMDFIRAKREDGRLRNFNLSLLITEEFMKAVENDEDWDLAFPAIGDEVNNPENKIIWLHHPVQEPFHTVKDGLTAHKVYQTIRARELWDIVMMSTYDFAEPGFILIDEVNTMNNNWFCEEIRATNPCGEQPLPPGGSCLLGSINLTKFVMHPFTDEASFDWERFSKVVRIFTRMLDNVVEINGLPLEIQRDEILRKRRHGMGFLGLGSALAMMKIRYGDEPSVRFTESVAKTLALEGYREGLRLAEEKGPAPVMEEEFAITEEMLRRRPDLKKIYQVGDVVKGKELWAKSRYMERIASIDAALVEKLAEVGCRFTHHSSIAPTGTISLSLANNASNGIEPSFAHRYFRNIIREGKKTKEQVAVYSYEYLSYRELVDETAEPENLPDYFVNTDTITPNDHIDVQAAAQKWVDSSISKTINVPTEISYDDFKDIYLYAYKNGLKGCTTFRFNPEAFQGVLVKDKDLESTVYRFELEDGTVLELKGSEKVEYDGEVHVVANLYDALKERLYGKF